MPCSCWRNIILLTGKVRVMLTMPLPHPATYSRHSRAGPDNGPVTGDTAGTSETAPGWYFLLPAATHSPVLHITTSFAIIVSIAVAPPPHFILVIVNSENIKPSKIFLVVHVTCPSMWIV